METLKEVKRRLKQYGPNPSMDLFQSVWNEVCMLQQGGAVRDQEEFNHVDMEYNKYKVPGWIEPGDIQSQEENWPGATAYTQRVSTDLEWRRPEILEASASANAKTQMKYSSTPAVSINPPSTSKAKKKQRGRRVKEMEVLEGECKLCDQLRREVETLKGQLDSATQSKKETDLQLHRLQDQLQDCQRELDKMRLSRDAAEVNVQSLEMEMTGLRDLLTAAERAKDNAAREREEAMAIGVLKVQAALGEKYHLESQIMQLEEKLETEQSHAGQLGDDLKKARLLNDQLRADGEAEQSKAQLLVKVHQQLEGRCQELQAELQVSITAWGGKCQQLQEQLNAETEQRHGIGEQLRQSKSMLYVAHQELEDERLQTVLHQQIQAELQASVAELKAEIVQLEAEIKKQQAVIELHQTEELEQEELFWPAVVEAAVLPTAQGRCRAGGPDPQLEGTAIMEAVDVDLFAEELPVDLGEVLELDAMLASEGALSPRKMGTPQNSTPTTQGAAKEETSFHLPRRPAGPVSDHPERLPSSWSQEELQPLRIVGIVVECARFKCLGGGHQQKERLRTVTAEWVLVRGLRRCPGEREMWGGIPVCPQMNILRLWTVMASYLAHNTARNLCTDWTRGVTCLLPRDYGPATRGTPRRPSDPTDGACVPAPWNFTNGAAKRQSERSRQWQAIRLGSKLALPFWKGGDM